MLRVHLERRRLLLAAATATGLAGCTGTGTDESSGTTCETLVVSGGATDGAVREARVVADDGHATLRVTLNPDEAGGVDAVRVTGTTDDYRIPLLEETPRQTYRQTLGRIPHAGRLRIAAVDQAGEAIDAITVEFRCERSRTDGGAEPEPETRLTR